MLFTGETYFILACGLFLLGAFLPTIKGSSKTFLNKSSHTLAMLASFSLFLSAVKVFLEGNICFVLKGWQPFGNINILIDSLSAFFLLLLAIVGFATSCFAINYCKEFYGKKLNLLIFLYNSFLLSMIGVVVVQNVLLFLIVWELMAVVSFLLVNYKQEDLKNNKAAYLYFITTSAGTVFIIIAFLILVQSAGSMNFSELTLSKESIGTGTIVFLLALIGFGTKAGIFPMHFWLPIAHPVAPSHISALMSGVMLKVAIYGLLRFVLSFLVNINLPMWCGMLVICLALFSCSIGIIGALKNVEIKRILAYSSIENVGLIFLGLGMALLFTTLSFTWLAALAWLATFYHIFNHALYKSLLFMGAGVIIQKTHEQSIDKMGGLIKYLPYTSVIMLVGVMSMVALPPFNGFFSEWLIFKSATSLQLAVLGNAGKIFGAFVIVFFAMTAALAMLAFIRLYGCVFLAKIRDVNVKKNMQKTIKESGTEPYLAIFPLFLLGAICLICGVWVAPVISIVSKVLVSCSKVDATMLQEITTDMFTIYTPGRELTGVWLILVIMALFILITLGIYYLHGRARRHKSDIWSCGIEIDSLMQYNATAFAMPIIKVLSSAKLDVKVEKFKKIFSYTVRKTIKTVRLMQAGSGNYYVAYILSATVVILIFSSRW